MRHMASSCLALVGHWRELEACQLLMARFTLKHRPAEETWQERKNKGAFGEIVCCR